MLSKYWMESEDSAKERKASELITYEVEGTYSERGELEDQSARLAKLLEIVGAIADELPDDAQKRVIRKTCVLHTPL